MNSKSDAAIQSAAVLLGVAAILSACGGGDGSANQDSARLLQAAPLATGTTTIELSNPSLPPDTARQLAQPTFHLAPVLLDAPEEDVAALSSYRAGHRQAIPAAFAQWSTRRLTVQALRARQGEAVQGALQTAAPRASSVTTYTPAQIRAAYGLPALPAAGAALTPAQAAQLGAGQTIYIVDAQDGVNVVAELAAFNQKFGLPSCTTKAIAINASLPLPAASASACEFSVVYSTTAGTMTSGRPAYNASWATEIALDVQWAHATAPLARIVLIEAATASFDALLGGAKLANAMGAGVVSMSFGGTESSGTAAADATFAQANMTYLAATGDSGAGVLWPSSSAHVLAVGGTTLSYSGAGTRSEVAWSGTGGGVSQYIATPSYQNNTVPGMGTPSRRTVADVAFNADPLSGQYVAVITPGNALPSWVSVGGTSMATPQWAGVIAIANAMRLQSGKSVLGAPHALLYGQIASVPGSYASNFADILSGSDGSCPACSAKTAYDQLTGLGTPNVANLLSTLSGATVNTPPVVTPATISGKVGTPLSFTVSASAANPLRYALSGAPSGLSINNSGAVNWPAPVAGSYAMTVTATDSKTGLSGSAVYTLAITASTAPALPTAPASPVQPVPPSAPVSGEQLISGHVGVPLTFSVAVAGSNPASYTMSGAPDGMTLSGSQASWPDPVSGVTAVTVTSKDLKTGASKAVIYMVQISAGGPVISSLPMTAVAGQWFMGEIGIADPGAFSTSVSITGLPMGMNYISASTSFGNGVRLTWTNPIVGNYAITVMIKDSQGGSAQQVVPLTVTAH